MSSCIISCPLPLHPSWVSGRVVWQPLLAVDARSPIWRGRILLALSFPVRAIADNSLAFFVSRSLPVPKTKMYFKKQNEGRSSKTYSSWQRFGWLTWAGSWSCGGFRVEIGNFYVGFPLYPIRVFDFNETVCTALLLFFFRFTFGSVAVLSTTRLFFSTVVRARLFLVLLFAPFLGLFRLSFFLELFRWREVAIAAFVVHKLSWNDPVESLIQKNSRQYNASKVIRQLFSRKSARRCLDLPRGILVN